MKGLINIDTRNSGGRSKSFLNFFLITFISFLSFSCADSTQRILFELSFDEVKELALKENKPFCIILSKTNCPPCQPFIEALSEKRHKLLKKAYFVVVDAEQAGDKWYLEWSMNMAFPSTFIFSPTGELKTIVLGSVAASFECIEDVLNDNMACAKFMFKHRFGDVSYDEVIGMLNDVLRCKQKLDRGEDISDDINKTISLIPYPYNIYLKYLNETRKGDNEVVAQLIEQILTYDEPIYQRIYANMYSKLKKDIYTEFELAQLPNLGVDSTEIILGECEMHVPKSFSVNLTNKGERILSLTDIITSCDCLKLGENEKRKMGIRPGESVTISFVFTPDKRGEIKRDIIIYSNSFNSPLRITTIAIVR